MFWRWKRFRKLQQGCKETRISPVWLPEWRISFIQAFDSSLQSSLASLGIWSLTTTEYHCNHPLYTPQWSSASCVFKQAGRDLCEGFTGHLLQVLTRQHCGRNWCGQNTWRSPSACRDSMHRWLLSVQHSLQNKLQQPPKQWLWNEAEDCLETWAIGAAPREETGKLAYTLRELLCIAGTFG